MPAPRFVIVIGANAAGKSTWCRAHPEELPSNFYDADSIAQGLGSYNDPALQLEARALVDEQKPLQIVQVGKRRIASRARQGNVLL